MTKKGSWMWTLVAQEGLCRNMKYLRRCFILKLWRLYSLVLKKDQLQGGSCLCPEGTWNRRLMWTILEFLGCFLVTKSSFTHSAMNGKIGKLSWRGPERSSTISNMSSVPAPLDEGRRLDLKGQAESNDCNAGGKINRNTRWILRITPFFLSPILWKD